MNYLSILKEFFKDREDIIMAFLFGSVAKGKSMKESDIDIAVYFKNYDEKLVFELWNDLEDLLKKDVDLVVLNIANATIAWEALRGKKIVVNDENFYLNYMLNVSMEAEDFREVVLDIYKIRQERRKNKMELCKDIYNR
ncbi:type VII toxin-antitoxin system MntA family adenylyltransferase antitoxin [Thermoanaerobacterium butyriciformans]|uniref:Nucleotidyltransferase n=1 Tax=Thermoanaerobacterium butyriciformans TaxID=1702242 RepID=A0ABS4NJB2_9THEO|nr:nucleotidyltransferase domain-containing protein [Thermoanaerobacterium butyriciformans]MBP2073135.1 putative nucleotidyltransferase [Thermoanaerobacterium butyriciformans]HHV75046.1 nucleotidyltransferase domain-containing protein [Thermoanaerobacterium sp.]